jgi:antitoxin YefM
MKTITFSDARKNFKSLLDSVTEDSHEAIITRRNGKDAVIMSLGDYNGWLETIHLLSTPANVKHLNKSIEQYHAGLMEGHELIDE